MVKPRAKTKVKDTILDIPDATESIALLPSYDEKALEMTPDMQAKIDKLMKFFDVNKIDYNKIDIEEKKTAYPNYDQYMYIPGQHDMGKWLTTVRTVYHYEKNGTGRVNAIRQATNGWKPMEVFDFLNWLKYYEEGAHMKYKFAQLWYENGAPGYFLEIKPDARKEETAPVNGGDIDAARDAAVQEISSTERKRIIEKQRNKIIGRLDSAEKLLRSPEGQMFAGQELEALMETIFGLKKKVQLVNKLSTSTRLYEDMIVREANVLNRKGFHKAAETIYALAQANNPPPPGMGTDKPTALTPDSPGDPSGAGHPGAPGGLPSMGPGMPQNAPPSAAPETGPNEMSPSNPKTPSSPAPTAGVSPAPPIPTEAPAPPGINQFLQNLQNSNITDSDTLEVEDQEEELTVKEAQMAIPPTPEGEILTDTPAPAPLNPRTPPKIDPAPKPERKKTAPVDIDPIEVTEDEVSPETISSFDAKMRSLFANTTLTDIVAKLEEVSNELKAKELSRKLSEIDMMLHGKQMSSLFPQLGEAQSKAIDFFNYSNSRIDDILSKLKGALSSSENVQKKPSSTEISPEDSAVKNTLQQDIYKEKQRKQMRKDQEAAELAGKTKETPQVEIGEDLGGARPAVVAPPAAPTPRPLG